MLLLIAILTLLTIIPVLVVLFWGRTAPSVQDSQNDAFSAFSMEQAFDPDRAIIWDTQVPALQLIASTGRQGLALAMLHPLYLGSCHRYPELYDGSTFESWLEFLKRLELISVDLGRASLRVEGQQFLRYRVTAEALVAASYTRDLDIRPCR